MRINGILLFLLLAAGAVHGSVEIVSLTDCPVEMTWTPIRIGGYKLLNGGDARILLVRGFPFSTQAWAVDLSLDGNLLSCDETDPGYQPVFSTAMDQNTGEIVLTASDTDGAILWTCNLEGTDEFSNYQQIVMLPDGSCLVNSPFDSHSIYTEIQMISSSGEMAWHYSLGTDYLLGLDDAIGETGADVSGMAMTSDGDVLVCGSVAQFYTSPVAWFVCLLDGGTGNPLWYSTGPGEGEARLLDVVEATDGNVVAVGETAESIVPEGMMYSVWGQRKPLLVILDSDGDLLSLEVPGGSHVHSLQALLEYDRGMDYAYDSVLPPLDFVIAGVDTTSEELVLVRTGITAD